MSRAARLAKAARRRPRSLYLWSAGDTYRLDAHQSDWVEATSPGMVAPLTDFAVDVDLDAFAAWWAHHLRRHSFETAARSALHAAYARRRKARTRRNRR